MPANINRNNVYSLRKQMWHSLGTVSETEETAGEVVSRMDVITYELRPYFIRLNGKKRESKDAAIIRIVDGDEREIGHTKGRYQITQPSTYAKIFDANVGRPVETAGYLGGEKADKFFITWTLPKLDVHGDEVETFGFMAVGYNGMFGEKVILTNVRVVCENTWGMAIAGAGAKQTDERMGVAYSGKHCYNSHEAVLASWLRFVQKDAEQRVALQQTLFCKMEETPLTVDAAAGLFAKVYPYADDVKAYYPDDLRDGQQEKIDTSNEKVDESRELAMSLFQGAGIAITPTVWGALNAVTEAENHHRKSKKNTTYSILLGNRQKIMENAMSVMAEHVSVVDAKKLSSKAYKK
jgi:hypothetical protein